MRRFARRSFVAAIAATALTAAGCASKGAPARVAAPAIDSAAFSPDLAIDLRQFTKSSAGIYSNDVIKGSGPVAAEGRKVTFRYAAFLVDGTAVETQRTPVEVEIGDSMIRGLRFGIPGMRAGGQRRLIVPPALAYRGSQYGKVPPNSILVFDIDLISVR
jgi:FKBP-type peptidyl-prolyl cis-trans isomerase FkpA